MFDKIKSFFSVPITEIRQAATTEQRAITLGDGLANGLILAGESGVTLTPQSVLGISGAYASIRHISDCLSSLPIKIMKLQEDGGRLPDCNHYLNDVFAEPCDHCTGKDFIEFQVGQLLIWGNAFSEITRANSGRVMGLFPLMSQYMQTLWDKGTRQVSYRLLESVYTMGRVYDQFELTAIKGISLDGIGGLNPLEYARQVHSTSLAVDVASGAWFANGMRPSYALCKDGTLSQQAWENLEESTRKNMAGPRNVARMWVLEEGLDPKPLNSNPDESQMLQTQQWQLEQESRFYKIPKSKLGSRQGATYSNLEQDNLQFVQECIAPICRKLELEYERKLLLPSEKGKWFIEFDFKHLLRADVKTRYANYASAIQAGWMTKQECRVMEGLPVEPEVGELLTPMNMSATVPVVEPDDKSKEEYQSNEETEST